MDSQLRNTAEREANLYELEAARLFEELIKWDSPNSVDHLIRKLAVICARVRQLREILETGGER